MALATFLAHLDSPPDPNDFSCSESNRVIPYLTTDSPVLQNRPNRKEVKTCETKRVNPSATSRLLRGEPPLPCCKDRESTNCCWSTNREPKDDWGYSAKYLQKYFIFLFISSEVQNITMLFVDNATRYMTCIQLRNRHKSKIYILLGDDKCDQM